MNKKSLFTIILSIIIIILWLSTYYYHKEYSNLFNDYSPSIIRWRNINPENNITNWTGKLTNNSNDIVLINIDDFKKNSYQFNITSWYVIISTELVRNEKIINWLWGGTISTIQHYGTRPDWTESVNEDKKCIIINWETKDECEYLSWESAQWQEYMKFKDYKPWDQILISIREMLPYGNSEYSWSIEKFN